MAHLVGPTLGSPTSIKDLKAGMVVFCSRPSFMQRCNDSAGDSWRHAGLLIDTDEGLMMCGFAPKKNYCLIPAEKLAMYARVGVASVLSDDQVSFLHQWVDQFERNPSAYPPSSLPMAGALSYARTLTPGLVRELIVALCVRYCLRMARRYRGQIAFICSTFVFAALNASRDEPLRLAMTADKVDRDRYVESNTTKDVLLSRWLATPSDLWRSIPAALRSEVSLSEALVGDDQVERAAMAGLVPASAGDGSWPPAILCERVDHHVPDAPAGVPNGRSRSVDRDARRVPALARLPSVGSVTEIESRYAMI